MKKTAALLLQVHDEETLSFGKDNSAKKNRRQQEKRKTKYKADSLREVADRFLQELSRAPEDRT